MNTPELLAPAGDYECFLSAIRAGADAVYLGGDFSARAYARFSPEEILSAIDHAHLYGRKVYLTLNTVMKCREMDQVRDYLMPFYLRGLDGVIVQDFGLFCLLKKQFPLLPLHASTQMTVTDLDGVLLLKELGADRVVLARELQLSEIERIRSHTDTELECFIHGALCYAYSGKCLLSSMLGERSGNRGRCAQPCRLPYDGEYLLSLKDICTLEVLPKLIDAGIASFKIEGRMKSADYVAGVVGIYRKYMDAYRKDPAKPYTVDPHDLSVLTKLYTRSGHESGYYFQRNGRKMVTIKKGGYERAAEEESKTVAGYYTKNHEKLPLSLKITLQKNEPAELTGSCNGHSACITSDPVLKAETKALTKQDVQKQLSKLGQTEFVLKDLETDMDPDVFFPVSGLNALRRELTEQLCLDLLAGYFRKEPENIRNEKPLTVPVTQKSILHVSVLTLKQAEAALMESATRILTLPLELLVQEEAQILKLLQNRKGMPSCTLVAALPYICREDYFTRNSEKISHVLAMQSVSAFLVRNPESLYALKKIRHQKELIGDLHLYALNHEAVSCFHELGITRTCAPVELHKKELLQRNVTGEDLIVYGRIPLMVSAQCVLKTREQCKKTAGMTQITDRMNMHFPVQNCCEDCYNVLYNSMPLSLHDENDLIEKLHPYSIRLMFTTEPEIKIRERIRQFEHLLIDHEAFTPDYPFTKGHLKRGVE